MKCSSGRMLLLPLLLIYLSWWPSVGAATGPSGATFKLLRSWTGVDPASFVDLNADRRTDTVVVVQGGDSTTHLEALMEPNAWVARETQDSQAPVLQALTSGPPSAGTKIRNVVAADFTGNSIVDLLVLTSDTVEGPFKAYIYRGSIEERKYESPLLIGEFVAQPLVCDINADMIADVYGETKNGARLLVLGGSVFTNFTVNAPTAWAPQGFAAYAPLLRDPVRSVIVLTKDKRLEVTQPKVTAQGRLDLGAVKYIELPPAFANGKIGNPVFGDFDSDGTIEILLAGCTKSDCSTSAIFMYSPPARKWTEVDARLTPMGSSADDGTWSLAPTEAFDGLALSPIVGPSVGDADLDGYPDLVVGLVHTSKTGNISRIPIILRNTFKEQNPAAVAFEAYRLPGVEPNSQKKESLRQVAFFDQNEDGVLDLFVSYQTESGTANTYLFVQTIPNERYFLKVMMTNGLCGGPGSCPANRIPYGLPGYGYQTSYSTKGENGGEIKATSVFVTSSCCGALQLPYTIFGFGEFANYIEQIPVSVPSPTLYPREHILTFIVPKAQVVVIPYPPDRPQDWQSKLFLEPLYNMKVIYVAITLIATCVLLIIIISVLQYLEMRADRQEQLQESQRFHFDAM